MRALARTHARAHTHLNPIQLNSYIYILCFVKEFQFTITIAKFFLYLLVVPVL